MAAINKDTRRVYATVVVVGRWRAGGGVDGGTGRDTTLAQLDAPKLMMKGMGRMETAYRVSSADEAVDINRKGCTLSRLVFWLLASNHFDDS
jgi:hypothetical protein